MSVRARARALALAASIAVVRVSLLPLLFAMLVALAPSLGCSTRDEGSTPESAVQLLIASVRAGDRGAVYDRFGARTRAYINDLLAASHKTGGTHMLRPQDLVTVGWVPPAWEPAGTRTLQRNGDEAEVEVYSAAGDRQSVHLVREGRTWKVELPLR